MFREYIREVSSFPDHRMSYPENRGKRVIHLFCTGFSCTKNLLDVLQAERCSNTLGYFLSISLIFFSLIVGTAIRHSF